MLEERKVRLAAAQRVVDLVEVQVDLEVAALVDPAVLAGEAMASPIHCLPSLTWTMTGSSRRRNLKRSWP